MIFTETDPLEIAMSPPLSKTPHCNERWPGARPIRRVDLHFEDDAGSARLRRHWNRAISDTLRSLRLAAQDVALSRRKQGFESPRERHKINDLEWTIRPILHGH